MVTTMTMNHHDAHGWITIHVDMDHLHRHHQATEDMGTAATHRHKDHRHTMKTTTTTRDRHHAIIHAIVAPKITTAQCQLRRGPVWHVDAPFV